ncbi:MAG: hypothetical protein LBL93_00795, partial [Ruminococcus sp.]|nr:hypothetical protein [Ruminococcus sp.]
YLGTDWSESTRKYAFKFPNDTNGFVASLLPSNLYNQVPLVDTVLHTVALMVMYLFVVTMLIFLFKVIHMKTAGIFAAMVYIASGAATCSGRMDLQWLFPTANSVIWVHYTAILREPIKPVWYSYAYFGVLIAGLVIANLIAVKKVNFYGGDD